MKQTIKDIAGAMEKAVPGSSFAIRFWDGEVLRTGGAEPAFTLWFKEKDAASRCIADGFLGFGESYMEGSLTVEGDLQLLLRLGFALGYTEHAMSTGQKIRTALMSILKRNSLTGSRKNISHHYDVGNDFYERLLGPSMAYTCAFYNRPDNTLEEAQNNKFELACRKLRLKEGEHIADLGCGWGSFLIYAAQNYGITGLGVTLSQEQVDFANRRIADLGLSDRIRVDYKDYRHIEGEYDKVASIGMMEHVGFQYISGAFTKIKRILKPRGLGLVHTIGNDLPHKPDPWTHKYIFPGGRVPALKHLIDGVCDNGMNVIDMENLRLHYELTLFHWIENFNRHEDWIVETYDEVFMRRYRLYLEVCASSFRYGDNRLFQVLFTNGLSDLQHMTRDHLRLDRRAE